MRPEPPELSCCIQNRIVNEYRSTENVRFTDLRHPNGKCSASRDRNGNQRPDKERRLKLPIIFIFLCDVHGMRKYSVSAAANQGGSLSRNNWESRVSPTRNYLEQHHTILGAPLTCYIHSLIRKFLASSFILCALFSFLHVNFRSCDLFILQRQPVHVAVVCR